MPKKAFKVFLEVEVHLLTSKTTQHLRNKEELYLTVSLFGHRKRTSLAEPFFPVPIHEKLSFDKTFFAALDPKEVLDFLENEPIAIELIQLSSAESNDENISLAVFENSARSFFFPARLGMGPKLGQEQSLMLETISDRLKYPVKLEYSTYSLVQESDTPYMDLMDSMFRQAHSGVSSRPKSKTRRSASRRRTKSGAKNRESGDEGKRNAQKTDRSRETERSTEKQRSNSVDSDSDNEFANRKPFVVKHVDPDMLMRAPGLHALDRENRREHPPPQKRKDKRRYRGLLIDPTRMGGIDDEGFAREETELRETFSSDDDEKFEKIKAELKSKEVRSLRKKKERARELLHDKYDRMKKREEVNESPSPSASESESEKDAKSTYSMYRQALKIGSKTGNLKIWRDPSYGERIQSLLRRLEASPDSLNTMEKLEIDVHRAKLRSTY